MTVPTNLPEWATIIITILIVFIGGSGLAPYFVEKFSLKKAQDANTIEKAKVMSDYQLADKTAAQTLQDFYGPVIKELQEENRQLKEQNKKLEERLDRLEDKYDEDLKAKQRQIDELTKDLDTEKARYNTFILNVQKHWVRVTTEPFPFDEE